MFFTLRKMVLLRTVHWKVLWGTKIGSSMASLWKPPFGTFIFKSEWSLSVLILSKSALCPCFLSSSDRGQCLQLVYSVLESTVNEQHSHSLLCQPCPAIWTKDSNNSTVFSEGSSSCISQQFWTSPSWPLHSLASSPHWLVCSRSGGLALPPAWTNL